MYWDVSMTQYRTLLVAGSRGLPDATQSFLDPHQVQTVRCHTFSEFENRIRQGVSACVVTDWEFQGLSLLELLDVLDSDALWVPLVVSARIEQTTTLVDVMRRGALAVVEPGSDERLSAYIWDALQCHQIRADRLRQIQETRACLNELTPEELAVLDMICAGHPNKVVAIQLEMGLRTVETRRQRVFRKLKVDTLAQLIHRVVEADMAQRELKYRSRSLSINTTRSVSTLDAQEPRQRGLDRHDRVHAIGAPQMVAETNALPLG
jgi:FixJ family two-component response regulator